MRGSAAARVVTRQASAADILAALQRAPARPITDEERALLAEIEGRPVRWMSHEEMMSELDSHSDPR